MPTPRQPRGEDEFDAKIMREIEKEDPLFRGEDPGPGAIEAFEGWVIDNYGWRIWELYQSDEWRNI